MSSQAARFVPADVGGYAVYSVPNGVAQILDAHSQAELLPVLAVLRKTASPREAEFLDDWTKIVRSGARGQRRDRLRTAGFWSGYRMVTHTAWSYSVPLYDHRSPRRSG